MNILVVNHYAGSPSHGMEYRHYYLAREWVKAGHHVTILGSSFSHLRSRQPVCKTSVAFEDIDGIHYIWFRTPPYSGNSSMRIINMLSFSFQLIVRSLPVTPDVVIDSSTYPLTIWGSHKIAGKYNARLVFEVHDLWPLTPMELGGYSPRHPFIVVLQHAENFAYRNADRVVSLLPKAKDHMVSHGMSPEKFVFIPNGIDISEWKCVETLPEEHEACLQKLKKQGKFIFGYAGTLGVANAMGYYIEAANLLRGDKSIHFLIVGQGPLENDLKSRAEKNHLKNVTFVPPVQKRYIPTLLSRMDALHIASHRSSLYRFGISPNKLMEYMMAGKPVINAIEAGNDPVAESGCGISVPSENPKAVAEAVLKLAGISDAERNALGENGRKYVLSHHDYSVLARRFLEGL